MSEKQEALGPELKQVLGDYEMLKQAHLTICLESKQYREALEKICDAVEPFVERFADGEPINPLGSALDEARETLNA